jgi:hypothetical protein
MLAVETFDKCCLMPDRRSRYQCQTDDRGTNATPSTGRMAPRAQRVVTNAHAIC